MIFDFASLFCHDDGMNKDLVMAKSWCGGYTTYVTAVAQKLDMNYIVCKLWG